jgi:hypothetical protein
MIDVETNIELYVSVYNYAKEKLVKGVLNTREHFERKKKKRLNKTK